MNTTPSQSGQAMSDERAACEATFPHLSHATALDEGLAAYRDTKMQGVWEGWQARAAASAQATVQAVAKITAADEYGPIIQWSTHWTELIGRSLYATPPQDGAQIRDAAILREALQELSNMYGSAWDRVDGALVTFDVERFEAAHEKARDALSQQPAPRGEG
ncbi:MULTISPECIES: hypothetical protein [unclassified Paraburkholderia]|uniref:hypothetical protein n=1 Tax=unclassified Paraburkholderia TaxID=2615204 RepID=UPI0016192767|nr:MULTISPECIES: hypothetical protein [unclassified Paraburkholderia]MBB5448409.1 uncharacterized protein YyaL (SSP411 family) [Paraburkholderia sp. WSM4177]MBB5488795.1 uncharacterized protein YyaL (SSP411 family) [Paraburkholderia sp. WSM4180]